MKIADLQTLTHARTHARTHTQDEHTEAIKWYTKCIELYPDRAAAYNNRAFCHLKMKNVKTPCVKFLKLMLSYFQFYVP